MNWLLLATAALWPIVLLLCFLLLGALRALALVRWRLDQLEATAPSRLGRSGLRPGKRAPDFTATGATGVNVSLHDFAGRPVLLVFTQPGCGPCRQIVPELNRLHDAGVPAVLAVSNGDQESTRKWATAAQVRFPLAVQEDLSLSKRYEVFATPFAFLIDERGIITSKGIVNNGQHIGFVLSGAGAKKGERETDPSAAEESESGSSQSTSHRKEVHHV
jgi:methylamine dehydrogenase accessory protein MauD